MVLERPSAFYGSCKFTILNKLEQSHPKVLECKIKHAPFSWGDKQSGAHNILVQIDNNSFQGHGE